MFSRFRSWWPAIACTLCYYAVVSICAYVGTRTTEGHIVYPLDDAYIHMAMAKNFSAHGVWGYTRYAFSSSTTSPLWTALLAIGYFSLGQNEWLPLFFNILIGTIFIFYLFHLFREEVSPVTGFLLLLAIAAATSVPALTLLGMEHLLHTLLTLAFVCCSAKALAQRDEARADTRLLLLLAALLPMARYEGCFAVATVCLLLSLQKGYRRAITLALAGAIPVLVYGAISVLQGWLFLPNSILLKGTRPVFSSFPAILDSLGGHSIAVLTATPVMLVLLVFALVTCGFRDKDDPLDNNSKTWWGAATFIFIMFLHLQFANVGWLFRYEAYLVAVGLAFTLPTLCQLGNTLLPRLTPLRLNRVPVLISALGLIALCFPLAERGMRAFVDTRTSMHDRYLEHIQPARFVREYYPASTVVVNDIGAVAYFADCRLLDLYGLGNMEPMRFRMSKSGYTKQDFDEWTTRENADIGILQVEWDEVWSRIPDSWVEVAEWKIPSNVVFGDRRIGFFAIQPDTADALASHILAFRSELPVEIEVQMMLGSPNKPDAGAGN